MRVKYARGPLVYNLSVKTSSSLNIDLFKIGIHTVQDEINFWKQNLLNSPTKSDKDKARAIVDIVEHLNEQIGYEDSHSLFSANISIHSVCQVRSNKLNKIFGRIPGLRSYNIRRIMAFAPFISTKSNG